LTRAAFADKLEQELQNRCARFSRGNVLDFIEATWPLILDDPDVVRWADEFSEWHAA
jgi:hypothetical protein